MAWDTSGPYAQVGDPVEYLGSCLLTLNGPALTIVDIWGVNRGRGDSGKAIFVASTLSVTLSYK